MLLALGSALGGWSLHILAGRLRYVHNLYGKERHVVESAGTLAAGDHRVEYEFTKDSGLGGTGVLRCDGREVGRGLIPRFTPSGFSGTGVGLTCGYEWGRPSAPATRRRSPSAARSAAPLSPLPAPSSGIRWPSWRRSCRSSDAAARSSG